VAALSTLGLLAGGAEVAVVADALERFVDAATERAVGAVLADGAVGTAPARMAAATRTTPANHKLSFVLNSKTLKLTSVYTGEKTFHVVTIASGGNLKR
jgi:hypothetical protein